MMKRLWTILGCLMAAVLVAWAADEIHVTCQLEVEKGVLQLERKPGTIDIDMTGDAISDIVQTITATSTDVVTVAAGVATNGVTWFRNLTTNTTRYVLIGRYYTSGDVTNFFPFLKLNAEDVALVRLHPTNVVRAVSVGGDVSLRTIVVED